jgi:hypothetical protein
MAEEESCVVAGFLKGGGEVDFGSLVVDLEAIGLEKKVFVDFNLGEGSRVEFCGGEVG